MASDTEIVPSERPCPITGSHDCEVVATRAREGHALRNVRSLESGLIFVDPLPVEDLAKYYKEDYRSEYKNVIQPKLKHIYRAGGVALDRLKHGGGATAITPGMKTLDIGAGGGEWAYLMSQVGCESRGVEPSNYGSFAKDSYDVDVFLGMYQDAELEKGSFDLVTLFQVLEHLADPVVDIAAMAEYLKVGGRFWIEVPDILFGGMRFDHKWHDGHLFGFDALTLEAVAAKAGLKKVSLDVLPGNLFGVFEKVEGEVEVPSLDGHCGESRAALNAATDGYWKRLDNYTKVPRRLVERSRELRVSKSIGEPRAILDHLIEKDEVVKAIAGA
ncbi:MAG: class I SAM-dependent methyltransferase [Verrucomicrobiales bacterium]|nr:class I SAM-dependent methyltransferase [Verrucomicrobiales bacterium]